MNLETWKFGQIGGGGTRHASMFATSSSRPASSRRGREHGVESRNLWSFEVANVMSNRLKIDLCETLKHRN